MISGIREEQMKPKKYSNKCYLKKTAIQFKNKSSHFFLNDTSLLIGKVFGNVTSTKLVNKRKLPRG